MSDRLLICHDDGIHMHCASEASRSDVLEWLGWEKCPNHRLTVYCSQEEKVVQWAGHFCSDGTHQDQECNCLDGLVPPASQVEVTARALFELELRPNDKRAWVSVPELVREWHRQQARAALIAAIREGVGE